MRVAVVGAGVIGLSAGIALAEAGHTVELLDQATGEKAASWGNAGHLATEQIAPLASLATLRGVLRHPFARSSALSLPLAMARTWLPFALRLIAASSPRRFGEGQSALRDLLGAALPAWHRLAVLLGEEPLILDHGHYVAWESVTSASKRGMAWQAAATGTARVVSATPEQLASIGALAGRPIAGAIRFEGTAQIADLDRLRRAMCARLLAAGGRVTVRHVDLTRVGTRAAIPGVDADLIVVAAGVASGALMRRLGHRVPIIAERGYHVRAAADCWPRDMPPIVFEDRSMIVTRYDHHVQASGFVEFGRSEAAPDPAKWRRLERHIAELGLPLAPPFARWMGSRPTLPDYLPAIGRSPRVDNLIYAFGHQHLGLTLAALTGEIVRHLAEGSTAPVAIGRCDLERFGGLGGPE